MHTLAAQITGDAPLNAEAQSHLVLELRRSLTDPAFAQDARDLLSQLRRRRDLLARIAEDIDEALGWSHASELGQKSDELERERLQLQQALAQKQVARLALEAERSLLLRRISELEAEPESDTPYSLTDDITGMEFVLIPAGTFVMGSNDGNDDEKPMRQVTISQPFYLGKYQVTQAQWEAVMGNNPSDLQGDANLPVEYILWQDAQDFIKKLNDRAGSDIYRLPTEAEWEYAARAGTTTAYSFGDDPGLLDQHGWHTGNSDGKTHPVGQLKPNPWGLYDMHGNVWEWVADWVETYPSALQTDPRGPQNGVYRVARGGSVFSSPEALRSAIRDGVEPERRFADLGFRCVRVPPSLAS